MFGVSLIATHCCEIGCGDIDVHVPAAAGPCRPDFNLFLSGNNQKVETNGSVNRYILFECPVLSSLDYGPDVPQCGSGERH
jgi:hypothetical protein